MFYIIFYTIVFSVHSWSTVLLVLRASICAINIFWMSEWMNKSWPALERIKNESSVTFLPKLSIFFSSIFNRFNAARFLFLLTLWLQQFQLHFYQLCEIQNIVISLCICIALYLHCRHGQGHISVGTNFIHERLFDGFIHFCSTCHSVTLKTQTRNSQIT